MKKLEWSVNTPDLLKDIIPFPWRTFCKTINQGGPMACGGKKKGGKKPPKK